MIAKTAYQAVKNQLLAVYPEHEAASIAFIVLNHFFGINKIDLILDKSLDWANQAAQIDSIVKRLLNHEPVQYIIGQTNFYGLTFELTPATLIPRPETEELVALIIKNHQGQQPQSLLDIGTGSGCIAIALAKAMAHTNLFAIDISPDALAVARINAQNNQVNIKFIKADILKPDFEQWPKHSFDIIVSNPPYVLDSEKKEMQANVLNYEPASALFVPDSDPLLFYKAIAQFAIQVLNPGGQLYFEINEQFGQETMAMLAGNGFKNITVIQDLHGKDRIVHATWA